MKKLIIARHGAYGDDLNLSPFGQQQMMSLAKQIKGHINGDRVVILSSTAPRAQQSAEILAQHLGVIHQLHDLLWSDSDHPHDHHEALKLVRTHKDSVDVIVLVTHLEYGEEFPQFFSNRELNGTRMDGNGIGKGQAWIIDCELKRMLLITSGVF